MVKIFDYNILIFFLKKKKKKKTIHFNENLIHNK